MSSTNPPVFDGHNDVLTRLLRAGGVDSVDSFQSGLPGHIDLPKAKLGGFGGGFFAIWVPSPANDDGQSQDLAMQQPSYHLPIDDPLKSNYAIGVALEEAAILHRLESLGFLTICTTVNEIRACLEAGTLAAIMHIEGAEAIDESFHLLDVLYRAGLRSLGPVWSRPTIFGEGVPFAYPASPDIGNGLTSLGKDLVRRCNVLGIMLDLSHLNEAGFWDVAKLSTAPLVATHSNAHALCQHARNLTDRQLNAIAETNGMVGLNFATAFLREDGQMRSNVPLEQMIRHLDHMINILGEDGVGLGSDFDGAVVPEKIGDISGLPVLREAMRSHGFGEELIAKICFANWLRVLEITWGEISES